MGLHKQFPWCLTLPKDRCLATQKRHKQLQRPSIRWTILQGINTLQQGVGSQRQVIFHQELAQQM